MKFLTAVAAFAALASAATPTKPRSAQDSQAIQDSLNTVIADTTALKNAVDAFSGVADVGGVTDALTKLRGDLSAGAATFSSLQPLTSAETLGLADSVGPLTSGTDDAVTSVINKKDAIVAAGAGGVAQQAFQDLKADALAYANALAPLAPGQLSSVVTGASDQIQASLDRGVAAYADVSGGTPPATTTGGTPPATTTGGTAPTGATTAPGTYPTTKVCPAGKHYRKRRAAREM